MSDRYWILDTRYWMLDSRCWMLRWLADGTAGFPGDVSESELEKNSKQLMSYRNLEIWQLSRELAVDVHCMTITKLPKFEMFEEGGQIRRSMKSVRSTIVEGYGRRRYKQEFIKFLTYSLASCDETTDHLETLFETKSLTDQPLYDILHQRLERLGKQLNNFIRSVERGHLSEK